MKTPDPELEKVLNTLKVVPSRDPDLGQQSRTCYLSEVDSIVSQAVSNSQNLRHINWKQKIKYLFQTRKELFPMLTQIISAILIAATLIAGGGGATVYASQNAMPGEMLYPLKTWSEDARLGLAHDAVNRFELNLEFANRRVEELISLGDEDLEEITDSGNSQVRLMERLRLHTEEAARLVNELEDPEMAMTRLQTQLRTQTKLLDLKLQSANPELQPLILQTRQMIQERLRLVNEDLEPQQIQEQNQVQEQNQIRLGTQTAKPEETGQGPNGPVGTAQGTPGGGYGPGPDPEETPTPGGQYGPGEPQTPVGPKNTGQPTQAPPAPPSPNDDDNGNGSGNGGKGGK